MAKILYVDGSTKDVEPLNGTDFSLKELRDIVGGYVEIVRLRHNPNHHKSILIVNEESWVLDNPGYNKWASDLYGDVIVGTVFYCNERQVR